MYLNAGQLGPHRTDVLTHFYDIAFHDEFSLSWNWR